MQSIAVLYVVDFKIEVTVALKSVLYGPVGTAGDYTTTVKE